MIAPRTMEEIMGHPNEAVIRKGYEAFSKGDIETLQNEIFTDDIVCTFLVGTRSPAITRASARCWASSVNSRS